ncbi:MAG: aldo/keto reductase [Bryobacteraceae bacterium]|nr:aldo/keto reductase [Bryobacteraceae bacterium]
MEYRTLGKTGLQVSALGFGGAEIGYEGASAAEVREIVHAALDAGVNVFDTAECYHGSEELLGEALQDHRGRIFLFTKCGHAQGMEGRDWDPDLIERSIDRSLRRLRTSALDLIQLHSCSRSILESGGVIEALERARDAGKTRWIGYSGDSQDAAFAVKTGAFDTLQISVNIADQESVDLAVPLAAARGMGVIAKRPIANAAWRYDALPSNFYHQEYWRRLRRLRYTGLEEDAVSTALRFTLAVPGVTTAIVGTKSPDRWKQNTAILSQPPLPDATFRAIRSTWSRRARPAWVGQT